MANGVDPVISPVAESASFPNAAVRATISCPSASVAAVGAGQSSGTGVRPAMTLGSTDRMAISRAGLEYSTRA